MGCLQIHQIGNIHFHANSEISLPIRIQWICNWNFPVGIPGILCVFWTVLWLPMVLFKQVLGVWLRERWQKIDELRFIQQRIYLVGKTENTWLSVYCLSFVPSSFFVALYNKLESTEVSRGDSSISDVPSRFKQVEPCISFKSRTWKWSKRSGLHFSGWPDSPIDQSRVLLIEVADSYWLKHWTDEETEVLCLTSYFSTKNHRMLTS